MMVPGSYKIKQLCWCGEQMMTDGKRRWCSTNPDGKPHDRHDLEGKKDPLRVDNHMTRPHPRH